VGRKLAGNLVVPAGLLNEMSNCLLQDRVDLLDNVDFFFLIVGFYDRIVEFPRLLFGRFGTLTHLE
jgi:hypothetical protein